MSDEAKISIYYGSDEGQASSAAHTHYQKLTAGGDGWGDEIIDGNAPTVDEACSIIHRCISALQTMNMFGGRKVIWLKGASFMGDSAQGCKSESVISALDELITCLGKLSEDTFFIVNSTEMDKRRSFFKSLGKVAEMQEFSKIDISKPGWERELAQFVRQLAQARGMSFTPAALDLFVHRVHESSRQIANELDKLSIYLGTQERALEEQDIELMVAVSRQGIIFEISRAIERGDAPQAVRLVNEQLESGEAPVAIIRAAFVPTLRNRFMARLLMDSYNLSADNYRSFEAALGKLPAEARKLMPLKKDGTPNAYGLFNAASNCRKTTLKQARRAMKACAEADRALVSSGGSGEDILHKLIATITA